MELWIGIGLVVVLAVFWKSKSKKRPSGGGSGAPGGSVPPNDQINLK